ncbi:uncharacterized protein LOC134177725 [Corticium candelabrum]|uniref:uncharacterized protein LOC134177725 n=1 Tax=Corticium candelabrum TaxID=121492 RepID=UPI002E2584EC|nr:uncharacterized protein LOC134177725 [Corticium candelabrum]
MHEGKAVVLSFEEGVHQGDPLGPVLFATSIHPVLVQIQNKNPQVQVLAYLDDVFVLGQEVNVLTAFNELKVAFSALGLDIADRKCEIYRPHTAPECPQNSIPTSSFGITILGSPIGMDSFVSEACVNSAEGGCHLCNKLVSLNDLQSAMLLLRYCHVSRLISLLRTVSPRLVYLAAEAHDLLTRNTFVSLLDLDVNSMCWEQVALPIRLGGFGLTSMVTISPFAFLASWVHSLQSLSWHFHELENLVANILASPQGTVGHDICQVLPPGSDIHNLVGSQKITTQSVT